MSDLQGVTREETLDQIESVGIEALRDYVEHLENDYQDLRQLLRECHKFLDHFASGDWTDSAFGLEQMQQNARSILEDVDNHLEDGD